METGVKNHSGKAEIKENFVDILLRIYEDNKAGASIDRDTTNSIILDVFAVRTDTLFVVLDWGMTKSGTPRVMKKLQTEVRGILRT
ncbi:cytochrome P450 71A8-like [Olea europaea subsp. europaea]|uniref:Cytochrome P450 71A8-like n=1 Tax=Olea europaea subsp. europaea TaxID=158383 RepID=A0A8S0P8V3_OLEEU|nr:cytochrome P450 71A8-like [Olea europaea subsp. europaea]